MHNLTSVMFDVSMTVWWEFEISVHGMLALTAKRKCLGRRQSCEGEVRELLRRVQQQRENHSRSNLQRPTPICRERRIDVSHARVAFPTSTHCHLQHRHQGATSENISLASRDNPSSRPLRHHAPSEEHRFKPSRGWRRASTCTCAFKGQQGQG